MPNHKPTYQRPIVGYHGCDKSTLRKVILEDERLQKSSNDYDWLGEGVYFWENGKSRAFEFAEEQKRRGTIAEPAVLGAFIQPGRCLDLTDVWATDLVRDYHALLCATFARQKRALPINRAPQSSKRDLLLRHLDCAVINFGLATTNADFQSVRGVFVEGELVYPNGGIYRKTHIQVAVRDPACIIGYFVPPGTTHRVPID